MCFSNGINLVLKKLDPPSVEGIRSASRTVRDGRVGRTSGRTDGTADGTSRVFELVAPALDDPRREQVVLDVGLPVRVAGCHQ